MARIRSIKQDFFLNEDLATVSSDARLLAIGLSTIADRCGRLEDRPLKIKAQLFPYHDVNIKTLLDELDQTGIGFIQRYSISEKHYIQIVNFEKHQKPHPKEPESNIPSIEAVEKHGKGVMHEPSAVEKNSSEDCTETNTGGSSARNGLRSGSGNGNGDFGSLDPGIGSGDPAGAGASADTESLKSEQQIHDFNIWTLGVGKLMAARVDGAEARSFLGSLRNKHGTEALSTAITKMLFQNPLDPKGYLVAVLKNGNGNGTSKPGANQTSAERRSAAVVRSRERAAELRSLGDGPVESILRRESGATG